MSHSTTFEPFPKIGRLFREMVITEKIDGTNAQINISEDGVVTAGSRKRIITPESDNFGFARWVQDNKDEILKLGPGRFYGEWWGLGIQRGYGLDHKRFSLFPTRTIEALPDCMKMVPQLYSGEFDMFVVRQVMMNLKENGSSAAPGYMNPEGIVVFHEGARVPFKVTFEFDEIGKGDG